MVVVGLAIDVVDVMGVKAPHSKYPPRTGASIVTWFW
jgi:hypothetical protein